VPDLREGRLACRRIMLAAEIARRPALIGSIIRRC
jgi:hypothetical protein